MFQMEATVEKYKRRMEDMAELRQQVKELDDLNSKYLDQVGGCWCLLERGYYLSGAYW